MTSRGNQSVSPPAQISQQRHVNTISSSTPPPQQYYPGQSSALSQGAYEFLPQAQSQSFNPYQAYGSALSDTRGHTGNSGRGVPPQQSLPQAGNFYQQPGPNIRPQQTHQGHAYFLSTQPQGNIRHSRPPHQSTSQQMMFIPQNFRPQNNVITIPAANMYQSGRVPVFQPNPFVPGTTYPANIVYYQNGAPAWSNPGIAPAATPAIRPQVREKRVLSIMDPDTGRDITEELFSSRSHSVSAEEHHEDATPVNQSDKDIVCQTFTRLVADRLKSPDDSSTSGASADSHGSVSGAPVSSGNAIAGQQYQQPPPQQAQQQPASVASATMMRPPPAVPHQIIPPRSGVIQQPPSPVTPSHDIPHQVLNVNLSVPPPQLPLRQSSQAIYSNVPQQQQPHPTHAPRHPQPPQQQQHIRQQIPPVVHPTSQQTQVLSQSQHQPPQSAHNLPSSTIIESASQAHKVDQSVPDIQKPQVEATSQDNIPAEPVTPTIEPAAEPLSPVKEVSSTPSHTAEVETTPSSKLSSMKTLADSEEINSIDKAEDSGKVEASHGGSQVAKDGRKGKKNKKDFIRKEIGGSDMDAFIDSIQKPKSNPLKTSVEGSGIISPLHDKDSEVKIIAETTSAKNMVKRDPKNPWKIQPAPEVPTLKREIQNPQTLRGPKPAQAEMTVSNSGVQERSGVKERSNPWKVLPVKTLDKSISNPIKDSEIKNKGPLFLKPLPDAEYEKNIAISTSDITQDFSVISTLPNSEISMSLTSSPHTISSYSLKTLSITPLKPECKIAVKNLETSHIVKASTQTSINENGESLRSNAYQWQDLITVTVPKFSSSPLHRNLSSSVLPLTPNREKTSTVKRLKIPNVKNNMTSSTIYYSQDCKNKVTSSVLSKSCKNNNACADTDLLLNSMPTFPYEGTSINKPACNPCPEIIPSIVPVNLSDHERGLRNTNLDKSPRLSRDPPSVDTVQTSQIQNYCSGMATQFEDQIDTMHKTLYSYIVASHDEARRGTLQHAQKTPGKLNAQHLSQKADETNSGAGENSITRTNNALDVAVEAASNGASVPPALSEYTVTKDLGVKQETITSKIPPSIGQNAQKHVPTPEVTAVSLDTGYSRDDSPVLQKSQEQQKQSVASAQVESKHKQKKKKKKGRKTPPNQKVKPCTSSNDNSEGQNEAAEVDEKPPLPPSVTDRKSSLDKSSVQDIKIISTASQETSKVTKEPLSPASTTPTHHSDVEEEDKTIIAPQKETKIVVEITPVTDITESASCNAPARNTNQQQSEQIGGSVQSNRCVPIQTERQTSKPLENGVCDDVRGEPAPVASRDITGDLFRSSLPFTSEGNVPSRESVPEQKDEDIKKGQSLGTSSEAVLTRQSSEKTVNKIKKDSKDKLQYDRAYLMELRECASSQAKPDGLPNLEIILDRPVINTNRGSVAAPLDFTPAFFQPSGNQRHAPQIGKTNSRNRSRADVQMPQRVIKSVSLQDSVKPLHQSEKPWKPTQKQVSAGEVAEKKRTLESEVLFIMNRLTPTNFERLAGEMRKLNIKTYEDLQELAKIFFDKVTMETKFVEAYANLCKVMSGLRVVPPANSGIKDNQATFRVVMLTKCQQEFEADKTVVFEDPEEKRKKIEAEMPEGPERMTQIENTLYQMKLKRLKFYGNIRFIGELFKLGLLTENIMHDCIYRLLKARDDDSLVSLCNLIATVGQVLDTDKAKTRMDQYFAQMGKIAEERKSRIKFTLKDAIDLRSNNWIPRKEQTGPKKIDEVHKDFQEEQATKQFLQSQPLPPRNDIPQPNSRRGSRQRQDDKVVDDGWNTVGSKSLRIDASKMKLSKNVVDENSIQLGPGGGMKFSMWGRGSFGGTQPSQDERSSAPANRFSALRGEEDRRSYQRSPSRGESGVSNRNMRQGPTAGHGRGKILTRSSQEGERRDALASARSIVGGRSQNSSRDNSWNREDHRQTMVPRGSREGENAMTRSDISLRPITDSLLPPSSVSPTVSTNAAGYDDDLVKKVKPLSEKEMEHKAKTILEEYLSVMDLEEAKLCLAELAGQKHLYLLVNSCINEVLEKSARERELTGSFFHEMIKHGRLPIDIYMKGLAEVLQYAEDMVIDIPMMWTYLAQIIVPLLIGGSLPWSSLTSTFKPVLGTKCAAKFIVEILLIAKEKTSKDDVALMWQSNSLDWSAFMPAEEVERFLKDKKVEFTVGPVTKAPSRVPVYGQVDFQKITEDIEGIIRENGKSREICAYIDAKVPVDKHDKHFIRALVTALVNVSISTPAMKFSEEILKTRKDVLQRCIKSDAELELQALYAIQALMHKLEHPSGVIATIFDILYDEEVISEEAFKQWEKSTDPQELEGKGACSMQLTQFFTWLRENEEPETS